MQRRLCQVLPVSGGTYLRYRFRYRSFNKQSFDSYPELRPLNRLLCS